MKNILLLVHDDSGQEARFQAALDVTRAMDGHLSCVDIALAPAMNEDYFSPGLGPILMSEEIEQEQANRGRLEQRLASEDVAWTSIEASGDPGEAMRRAARLCDLIVVNSDLQKFPHPRLSEIAGELIVSSGKPVLAVPADMRKLNPFGGALVAWDGSREAETALRAAVPLLAHASGVTLFEVEDGSVKLHAEAAAEYLSRHGIHAAIHRVTGVGTHPGDAILKAIGDMKPDYVVMGGFSRPRLIESMFGGVTRQLFDHSPVPLFLAH
ncbi:universal stress protein [Stakelama sp. CBK3Z-3]|uniref:Universal stress protein n=2 Tax=Stakelama flava TaxID=2860338 RepID=A0ABS6XQ83_9SPHN|nr:universal stress protein [Stakelama flava]